MYSMKHDVSYCTHKCFITGETLKLEKGVILIGTRRESEC
jgi:hypothetical protein